MNETLTQSLSPRLAGETLARLGASHGYHFEGDTVRLNAMFRVAQPAAHERNWALQLWACAQAPDTASELAGHLVAQACLPPIGEIADETHGFEVATLAAPPAGEGGYYMVLALVSGRNRETAEIHDFATYAQREQFPAPRLRGAVACQVDGTRVKVAVGGIENPRDAANRSGTLSLELWALPARYAGGAFEGFWLTGVTMDSLVGGDQAFDCGFEATFAPPPAGVWQLVLMLREWTAAGFVTRDYFNFETPFAQAPAAPAAKAAPVPATPVAQASAPAPVAAPQKSAAKADHLVSINHAPVDRLAEVKGLPEKVAKAIIKERPFRSLDELTRVKGMGAKLLAKVRASLKL